MRSVRYDDIPGNAEVFDGRIHRCIQFAWVGFGIRWTPRESGLLLAILEPEACCQAALFNARVETGDIAFSYLNGMDEFRFAEFTGRDLCLFCYFLDLLYCHD